MNGTLPKDFLPLQGRKKFEKILGSFKPTTPPDLCSFFDPDALAVAPLHDGALFTSWSNESGILEHVFITLDPLNHQFTLEWRKEPTKRSTLAEISTLDLQLVLRGDAPKDLKSIEKSLHTTTELTSDNFFTIFSGEWPWDELHLTSEHCLVVQTWVRAIKALIAAVRQDSHSKISAHGNEYRLKCLYVKMFRKHGSKLNPTTVVQEFAQVKTWKARKILYDILLEDHALVKNLLKEDGCVTFKSFHALYLNYAMLHQDCLRSLYDRYARTNGCLNRAMQTFRVKSEADIVTSPKQTRRRSSIGVSLREFVEKLSGTSSNGKIHKKASTLTFTPQEQPPDNPPLKESAMSLKMFARFLRVTQDINGATWKDALEILQQCDPLAEASGKEEDISEDSTVSLRGFASYLLGAEGNAVRFDQIGAVYQSMDYPLTDYFISSSHNTYLTGHQLYGESNVSMYIMVLNLGCRCVELDCWDGDNGQPVIYHGMTLVTKINFEDVVRAIAKHAFVASPYPVILSLENHCSIPQQQIMVRTMKNEFGSLLLTESLDYGYDVDSLPSPEELKYKILVKNKKIPCTEDKLSRSECLKRAQSLDVLDELNRPTTITVKRNSFRQKNGHRKMSLFTEPVHPIVPFCTLSFNESSDRLVTEPENVSLQSSSTSDSGHVSQDPQQVSRSPSGGSGASTASEHEHVFLMQRSSPTEDEEDNSFTRGTSSLLSSKTVDSFKESRSPLPQLKLDGKNGSLYQPCNRRKMSLFTEGVPALPLVSSTIDEQPDNTSREDDSPSTVDDTNEPLTPLPQDKVEGSSGRACQQGHRRKMSLFTEGVPALSLVSSTIDEQPSLQKSSKRSCSLLSLSTPDTKDECFAQSAPLQAVSRAMKGKIGKNLKRMSTCVEDHFENNVELECGRLSASEERRHSFDLLEGIDSPKNTLERKISPIGLGYFDTVETACSGRSIAQELSDIVIYLEPLKFLSFKSNPWREMKRMEMFSISEASAKKCIKKTPLDLAEYSVTNLSRIYPSATRINSSNFSPGQFWMHGCQMVALNYQTNDYGMVHNTTLFQLNNHCGYILKPKNLHKTCKSYYQNQLEGKKMNITITLISGQHLTPSASTHSNNGRKTGQPHQGLPTVEVEVLGAPSESYRFKLVATACKGDTAVWRQSNSVAVSLAFHSFTIIKLSSGNAATTLPLLALQPGYRMFYLATKGKMAASKIPSIFARIHIEQPDEPEESSTGDTHRGQEVPLGVKCPEEGDRDANCAAVLKQNSPKQSKLNDSACDGRVSHKGDDGGDSVVGLNCSDDHYMQTNGQVDSEGEGEGFTVYGGIACSNEDGISMMLDVCDADSDDCITRLDYRSDNETQTILVVLSMEGRGRDDGVLMVDDGSENLEVCEDDSSVSRLQVLDVVKACDISKQREENGRKNGIFTEMHKAASPLPSLYSVHTSLEED